jgi:hypothetical protein
MTALPAFPANDYPKRNELAQSEPKPSEFVSLALVTRPRPKRRTLGVPAGDKHGTMVLSEAAAQPVPHHVLRMGNAAHLVSLCGPAMNLALLSPGRGGAGSGIQWVGGVSHHPAAAPGPSV